MPYVLLLYRISNPRLLCTTSSFSNVGQQSEVGLTVDHQDFSNSLESDYSVCRDKVDGRSPENTLQGSRSLRLKSLLMTLTDV